MTVFHFSGTTFLASDKYISWCSLWLFVSFAYPFCFKYSSISATVAGSSSKDPKCMIWTQKPTASGWCPKGRVNRSGSPRRLKAKYTPRTNLKICTPDISLLQRILYQCRALQPLYWYRENYIAIFCCCPSVNCHRNSSNWQVGYKMRMLIAKLFEYES